MSSEDSKPTLYERLGGVYSIATVVDDFIDRVMRNQILNANSAVDEAHHRVSAAGFKYYVTEMVCWATGGPQKYTGRSMSESHKHLKITESEWAVGGWTYSGKDYPGTADVYASVNLGDL